MKHTIGLSELTGFTTKTIIATSTEDNKTLYIENCLTTEESITYFIVEFKGKALLQTKSLTEAISFYNRH